MMSYGSNNVPGVVVSQGGLDVRQDTTAVPGKGSAFHYGELTPGLNPGRFITRGVFLPSMDAGAAGQVVRFAEARVHRRSG